MNIETLLNFSVPFQCNGITGDGTAHPSHPIRTANGQSSLFVTAKPSLKHQDFDLSAFEPKHLVLFRNI